MKARTRRFIWIAVGVLVLCELQQFVLNAFQSNLVFFFTPTQVSQGEAPKGRTFRAGGMVKDNSLVRDGNSVKFIITDTVQEIPVVYVGLLPDLFKEGKGVVAQGKLGDDWCLCSQ
jgi:cytochrome c-type biogenesis protein CcmE